MFIVKLSIKHPSSSVGSDMFIKIVPDDPTQKSQKGNRQACGNSVTVWMVKALHVSE
jgi:hypothetical protein